MIQISIITSNGNLANKKPTLLKATYVFVVLNAEELRGCIVSPAYNGPVYSSHLAISQGTTCYTGLTVLDNFNYLKEKAKLIRSSLSSLIS